MPLDAQKEHLAYKACWRKLPTDPVIVANPDTYLNNPMVQAVFAASDGRLPPHDPGAGLRKLNNLVRLGAVTAVRNADGSITYARAATFPDEPQTLDWVAEKNAELKRLAAQEQAWRDREYEAQVAAQKVIDAPLIAAAQADFYRGLRESGLTERLDKIEAAIARLEAAVNNGAHTEAREVVNT